MDPAKIMIGGASAGGNLAAALALKVRDENLVKPLAQILVYPMLDDRMETESMKGNDAPVWNERSNQAAWQLYLRNQPDRNTISKYAAPARETNYSDLPDTIGLIGTLDPFLDETLDYLQNLAMAGSRIHYSIWGGCYHGFDSVLPWAKVSQAAHDELIRWIRKLFRSA